MRAPPYMTHCCPPFGLAAPLVGRFNQRGPGSSCGSHRERPQAGEPGLIARQAPGSLSHPGAVAVSCGFDVRR